MSMSTRRSAKGSKSNKTKKALGLWIDASRLPTAKLHRLPSPKPKDDHIASRYLELADLLLNDTDEAGKKKTA
jgi:hypothetical protein